MGAHRGMRPLWSVGFIQATEPSPGEESGCRITDSKPERRLS